MLALLTSAALAAPDPAAFSRHDAPLGADDAVRLAFVGDSGHVPDAAGCRWRPDGSATADCHTTVGERARLTASVRAEDPDAVYGLGDLTYPMGPRCRRATGEPHALLASTIGAVYADLGAPAWLVLGNHDVGHQGTDVRRLECLLDFADRVPGLQLPSAQYAVDHGVVTVVVINSNERDQSVWPAGPIRAAQRSGDWVIVAAHHELRTGFEKESESLWEPPPPGQWLVEEGLTPDLWANGHAHTLQLGVYDARTADDGEASPDDGGERLVPALTSGAGSKVRANPTCGVAAAFTDDREACGAPHPRGMPLFAMARFGFATVDLTRDEMLVRILDLDGVELARWARSRDEVPRALAPPPTAPPPAALPSTAPPPTALPPTALPPT